MYLDPIHSPISWHSPSAPATSPTPANQGKFKEFNVPLHMSRNPFRQTKHLLGGLDDLLSNYPN